jgi:hypothetical protein
MVAYQKKSALLIMMRKRLVVSAFQRQSNGFIPYQYCFNALNFNSLYVFLFVYKP